MITYLTDSKIFYVSEFFPINVEESSTLTPPYNSYTLEDLNKIRTQLKDSEIFKIFKLTGFYNSISDMFKFNTALPLDQQGSGLQTFIALLILVIIKSPQPIKIYRCDCSFHPVLRPYIVELLSIILCGIHTSNLVTFSNYITIPETKLYKYIESLNLQIPEYV